MYLPRHVVKHFGKVGVIILGVFLLLSISLASSKLPTTFTIGVCTHHPGHGYNSMPMLEKMGAKIVRDEMVWQLVERTKGRFSGDQRMVDYANALHARNVKLLMILDYSNTVYAPNDKYGPDSQELREAFGRYVSFLVSTFKGKVFAWEIWNEPDTKNFWQPSASFKNYSLLVKYVAPIIRQIDPKALVVAGALANPDLSFLDSMRKEGALKDVDVLSFHWYTRPKAPEQATGARSVANITSLVQSIQRLGKRAWITEMGYSTSTNKYGVSEINQGEYLKKQLELAKQMGVEVCIIYDLIDDGSNASNHDHRYGLFRQDGSPKPAASVVQSFAH